MNKTLRVLVPFALPLIGALFAVFSIIGAATIIDEARPIEWIPFVLAGLAVALSQRAPLIAVFLALPAALLPTLVLAFVNPDRTWPIYFAVLLVIAVTAAAQRPWPRWASLALAVSVVAAVMHYTGADRVLSADRPVDAIFAFAFIGLPIVAVWAIGYAVGMGIARLAEVRRRHALEAEMAASETELMMAIERDRIAQDVHDIMAHSLSVIVAQADGARFVRHKQAGAVDDGLIAIADSARESLAEVRLLIEGLSSTTDGHSHPSLAEIPALVARLETAGLAIETVEHGERAKLTLGQELALYRIVQESLTNALNHSGTEPSARMTWNWQGPGLSLVIASTGDSCDAPSTAGSRAREASKARTPRGITGMRERARLAGGWLAAEQDADDPQRFVVTVFVPSGANIGFVGGDESVLAAASGAQA